MIRLSFLACTWTLHALFFTCATLTASTWGPLKTQPDPGFLQIKQSPALSTGGSESNFTLSLDQLAALGAKTHSVYIPYINKTLEAQVLPLSELLKTHGGESADTILAYCYDGYVSYYSADFIQQYAPYLVMSFAGREPGDLTLEGSPDLGPFYITMDAKPAVGSKALPDPDNKRPFGVFMVEVGSERALLGPLSKTVMPALSAKVEQGRQYWVNNCMSCHSWNKDGYGGKLSNRTAELLAIHARVNKKYFYDFIIDPTQMITDVKMPKHPHYDDAAIGSIRAFLRQQVKP